LDTRFEIQQKLQINKISRPRILESKVYTERYKLLGEHGRKSSSTLKILHCALSHHFFSPIQEPHQRGLVGALGVVVVHGLAGTSRAALGAREARSTALSPESSAASTTGSRGSLGRSSGRDADGGHGGGLSSSRRGSLFFGWGGGSRAAGTTGSGSALPDSWAGHGESLAAVVDAEVGVGVGGLVSTGELDHGTGSTAAAALNLDLHARDVVLGLVDVGAVNTNVLGAEQVFAVGGILGDLGGNEVAVVITPGGGGEVTAIADTLLVDLEPVARSIVFLDTASRGLGHVHQTGAGVLELGTDSQLELDFLTGVDGQDLGLASRGERALVADDIGAICGGLVADIGGRVGRELDGVVLGRAARLADVLESRLSNTANNVGVEEVVGGGHLGDSAKGKSRELHSDRAVTNVFC
jgi:hypothetical protein